MLSFSDTRVLFRLLRVLSCPKCLLFTCLASCASKVFIVMQYETILLEMTRELLFLWHLLQCQMYLQMVHVFLLCILYIFSVVSACISYLLDPEESIDKGSVNWCLFSIYVPFVTEKMLNVCILSKMLYSY